MRMKTQVKVREGERKRHVQGKERKDGKAAEREEEKEDEKENRKKQIHIY